MIRNKVIFSIVSLVILFTASQSIPAFAQSDTEIKRDQYLRAAAKSLKSKQYEKALNYIAKIKRLDVHMPATLKYFEGEAYLRTGQTGLARSALRAYIRAVGKKGRYYTAALDLMNEAEETSAGSSQELVKLLRKGFSGKKGRFSLTHTSGSGSMWETYREDSATCKVEGRWKAHAFLPDELNPYRIVYQTARSKTVLNTTCRSNLFIADYYYKLDKPYSKHKAVRDGSKYRWKEQGERFGKDYVKASEKFPLATLLDFKKGIKVREISYINNCSGRGRFKVPKAVSGDGGKWHACAGGSRAFIYSINGLRFIGYKKDVDKLLKLIDEIQRSAKNAG